MSADERRPMAPLPRTSGLTPWSETRKWTAMGGGDSRLYTTIQRGERFALGWQKWADFDGAFGPFKFIARFDTLAEAQEAAAAHDKEEW